MIPIVIDTDPGQDDAVAILLALARPDIFDLSCITAVAGNVPVAQTALNARRIVELAGHPEALVYAGAAAPLVLPLTTAEFVCGPDGMDGAGLPPAALPPEAGHAVSVLIETLQRAPATICALGPLTNLALALRLAPEIAGNITQVVLMGGAMNLGNITPAAEYNFYADPHAAAVVLNAGLRVTLIGLHLTLSAIASPAHVARIATLNTATSRAVHGMLTRPRPGNLGSNGHPMHDVCVPGYLAWPELFTGRDCHVGIDTSDGDLRGRSTIDWHNRLKRPANVFVLDSIDATVFFDRVIDALALLP